MKKIIDWIVEIKELSTIERFGRLVVLFGGAIMALFLLAVIFGPIILGLALGLCLATVLAGFVAEAME